MPYKISLIIEAILLIICIHDLYGISLKIDIAFIIFLLCDLVLMESIKEGYLPSWGNSVIYPMILIYCIKKFGVNIKKLFINIVLGLFILSILQIICVNIVYVCIGELFKEEIITLCTYLIMILIYSFTRKKLNIYRFSDYFQQPYVLIRTCLIVGGVIVVACIILTKVYERFYCIEFMIIAISIIVITAMATSWVKYKEKSIEAEARLDAYMLYEKSYENLILEIRMRQHEFDNHLSAIYNQHILYKDYDSLVRHQQDYCKSLKQDNRYSKLLKVNKTVLIGFLYGKFIEAEKKGITVLYDIRTPNVLEGVPEYKVVEIIGNLINNAIDTLQFMERKMLSLEAYRNDIYSVLTIKNISPVIQPYEIVKYFEKGYSSKGRDRGLGLYNIKKMSLEYSFEILYGNNLEDESNWLYITIRKKL